MTHEDLFKTEWVKVALDRYRYNTVEDMYSSVGFGAISAGKIVAKLLEEYKKEHEEETIEEKIKELSKKATVHKVPTSGVVVKGIDNCLVKFSKCCNPVPGDNIIGYITKGRGVSIHRTNCTNVKDLIEEEGRIIDVAWYEDEPVKASYHVDIEVLSNDRTGLLSDIVKEITSQKINIMGVNTKTSKDRIATIEITLEVENIEQLNKIIKLIRKVDSVYEVNRKK